MFLEQAGSGEIHGRRCLAAIADELGFSWKQPVNWGKLLSIPGRNAGLGKVNLSAKFLGAGGKASLPLCISTSEVGPHREHSGRTRESQPH